MTSPRPTPLLHEAYLNINRRDEAAFPDRARFMGYAAKVMRGLLIDYVRGRKAQKRGGHFVIGSLPDEVPSPSAAGDQRARIGAALDEMAILDPPLAELVDLKFFCGFSFGGIAAMRSVSERTVERLWDKARLLLHDLLRD